MTTTLPICLECKWYNPDKEKLRCKAYPNGIPEEIIYGKIDHHRHYDGDHGVQFERK